MQNSKKNVLISHSDGRYHKTVKIEQDESFNWHLQKLIKHDNGFGKSVTQRGTRCDTYEGQWKNNVKHGFGKSVTQRSTGCDTYEGQWKNNVKHGYGKFTYSNGTVHEGEVSFGSKHGYGIETSPGGTIDEGQWKKSHKNGTFMKSKYKKYEDIEYKQLINTTNFIDGEEVAPNEIVDTIFQVTRVKNVHNGEENVHNGEEVRQNEINIDNNLYEGKFNFLTQADASQFINGQPGFNNNIQLNAKANVSQFQFTNQDDNRPQKKVRFAKDSSPISSKESSQISSKEM